MELAGRVVIITGASSGIGAATARLAASEGAKVVLVARRADRLDALSRELPGSTAVRADLREPAEVHRMVQRALETHGRVDVLVNNAGQGLHLPIADVKLEDLHAVMQLNLYAPLVAMQAVLPAMRRQKAGAIVNVSSGTSRMVLPGVGAYAATKAALNMLSLVARAELARDGIAVSVVYPSITKTEFQLSLRAGSFDPSLTPLAQSAESVAEAIVGVIRSGEAEVVLGHKPAT
jgi:short-subunit dehydrogenase